MDSMLSTPRPSRRAVGILVPALLAGLSLLFWWAGWYPGFMSVESVDQWSEVVSGDFTNRVPAAHTLFVWFITLPWRSPALVTLLQVVAATALLVAFSRAVMRLGAPWWVPGIAVILFGFLPGPASALVAFDVHAAQTLVSIWLLVELLEIAVNPTRTLGRTGTQVRLGIALGTLWLFAQTGFLVVVLIGVGLAVAFRRRLDLLRLPAAIALGSVVVIQGPVFALVGVDREVTPIAEAYAPEIAAVVRHDPGAFGERDRALLEAVADLDVWAGAYRCGEGISLIEDRDFDRSVIRENPGVYRGLLFRTAVRRPHIVIGHRLCASGVIFLPRQPQGERFEAYVYNVPANPDGVTRDSRSTTAFNVTKAILVRTDRQGSLWLFWRPAVLVWPAIALYAVAVWRRRRRLLYPGLVFGAVLAVTVATIRAPEFRQVFAVYGLSLLSLPLWWLALDRRSA